MLPPRPGREFSTLTANRCAKVMSLYQRIGTNLSCVWISSGNRRWHGAEGKQMMKQIQNAETSP